MTRIDPFRSFSILSAPMEFIPDHDGLFNSLESGKAFVYCVSCRLPLVEEPPQTEDYGIVQESISPHLVAKSFHKGECVFEYALCEGCRSNMSKELSEESQKSLADFFARKMDIQERMERLAGKKDPLDWIADCATCRKPRFEAENFSIAGLFYGHELMINPYPACFCGDCEEEIQAGLSKKTLDVWDDFVETNFDSPPSNVRDLPVGGRPLFI